MYICEKCGKAVADESITMRCGQWFCLDCDRIMFLLDAIARQFGILTHVLTSRTQYQYACQYRYAAWRFFFDRGYTYQAIGEIFHRHHSVIMRGMLKAEPKLCAQLEGIDEH